MHVIDLRKQMRINQYNLNTILKNKGIKNLMATMLNWYRITFNDTVWRFDTARGPKDGDTCPLVASELFSSGLSEVFKSVTSFSEILRNMESRGYITNITLRADSDILGPGALRCEFLFPSEVFIPTSHTLKMGRSSLILDPRLVVLKECKYISSGKLDIGISSIEATSVSVLRRVKGPAFIGCMDDNPFGVLTKKPSDDKNTATEK